MDNQDIFRSSCHFYRKRRQKYYDSTWKITLVYQYLRRIKIKYTSLLILVHLKRHVWLFKFLDCVNNIFSLPTTKKTPRNEYDIAEEYY